MRAQQPCVLRRAAAVAAAAVATAMLTWTGVGRGRSGVLLLRVRGHGADELRHPGAQRQPGGHQVPDREARPGAIGVLLRPAVAAAAPGHAPPGILIAVHPVAYDGSPGARSQPWSTQQAPPAHSSGGQPSTPACQLQLDAAAATGASGGSGVGTRAVPNLFCNIRPPSPAALVCGGGSHYWGRPQRAPSRRDSLYSFLSRAPNWHLLDYARRTAGARFRYQAADAVCQAFWDPSEDLHDAGPPKPNSAGSLG